MINTSNKQNYILIGLFYIQLVYQLFLLSNSSIKNKIYVSTDFWQLKNAAE